MEEKYKEQIKYLDRKIEKLNFWSTRLSENESREEWGLKLLEDERMMIEIKDSLDKKHFSIERLPLARTLIKEEDYNRIENSPIDKEYFIRRMYFNFIDSRSIEELEKYIEINVGHESYISDNDLIATADWINK